MKAAQVCALATAFVTVATAAAYTSFVALSWLAKQLEQMEPTA